MRAPPILDGLFAMGTKYFATNNDRKANERFLRKQSALPKVKPVVRAPSTKKTKVK